MPHLLSVRDIPLADMLERIRSWRTSETPAPHPKGSVSLLFYEPSTRTRGAFEQACVLLGYHPLVLTPSVSSIVKGESLADTVRTLCAQGVQAIVLRHPHAGSAQTASQFASVPIINAGDGAHEHPTQALLDLYTLWEHFGMPDPRTRWLEGVKIAIVGDVKHSRVARSNALLLTHVGAEVWFCAPPTLLPDAPLANIRYTHKLEEALQNTRVVIALRLQRERMESSLLPSLNVYRRDYQIRPDRLARAHPDCVVMHPGPIQRGVEIDDAIADGSHSLILTQVRVGLAVRVACLEYALGTEVR